MLWMKNIHLDSGVYLFTYSFPYINTSKMERMMQMNYHNIVHQDMLNGNGMRTTLFCSGCNHACPGCQNPQTWNDKSGIEFDEDAKKELMESLDSKWISGVTFSGGDPLYPGNRQTITQLAKEIKERFPDKSIWMYTGYTYEQISTLPVLDYVDVLVDGEYMQQQRNINLQWRGSENQRVIDIPKTKQMGEIVLLVDDAVKKEEPAAEEEIEL